MWGVEGVILKRGLEAPARPGRSTLGQSNYEGRVRGLEHLKPRSPVREPEWGRCFVRYPGQAQSPPRSALLDVLDHFRYRNDPLLASTPAHDLHLNPYPHSQAPASSAT